jgi:hypothetical protein
VRALSTIQRAGTAAGEFKRHRRSTRRAERALRSIGSVKGTLPRELKAQADDYASDVLGWKGYAPWLHVYTAVAGEFREGWIPDNYYRRVVLPAINGRHAALGNLRSLTVRLFGEDGVPDRGYIVNGRLLSSHLDVVTSSAEFADLVFDGATRVVFKADHSFQGRGLRTFDRTEFVRAAPTLPNGVIQPYIDQHPTFAKFTDRAVATVRLTSVVEPDAKVAVRAASIRFGRDSDDFVSSASHVRVPLDLETGALGDVGYTVGWLETATHPDSGVAFAGSTVPNYPACRRFVERLHRCNPQNTCLGWDLTVDREGTVHLLEWNSEYAGITFSEATRGPCFQGLGWEALAS